MEPAEAAAAGCTGGGAGRRADLPRYLLRAAVGAGHPARIGPCPAATAAGQRWRHPHRLERTAPLVATDHRAGGVQHRCRAGHRRHTAHATPASASAVSRCC
ncbi:hypothetical protein G6F23_014887 [Rhizopus arrhizus]|nr:hypothetical protein G6F23_014887 [Rhizopus arrhizus]